jgi:hypothetical protein
MDLTQRSGVALVKQYKDVWTHFVQSHFHDCFPLAARISWTVVLSNFQIFPDSRLAEPSKDLIS